jgi:hypothetical protein
LLDDRTSFGTWSFAPSQTLQHCVQNTIEILADIFRQKTENQIAVLLQHSVFSAIATISMTFYARVKCPIVDKKKRVEARFALARSLASEHGGRLASKQVGDSLAKALWECHEGHQWRATVDEIRYGRWCSDCDKPSLQDMQRLAKQRGGQCLASAYTDSKTKVRWRCAKGHQWMSHWNSVQYHWCPKCARIQKLDLKEFKTLARQRGGRLLSNEYINAATPLLWRCAQRHTWWAEPGSVKDRKYSQGTWCRECAILAQRGRRHPDVTLEDMQEIARHRGGECISEVYVNAYTKLKWRCGRGHEWMANRTTIKRCWCPECAKKLSFEQVSETASLHEGKVLSDSSQFSSGASVLEWQCKEGHRWTDSALRVRQGGWCPQCLANSRWSLEDMKEIARKRGGECLSRRYAHFESPLRWRCAEGHVFRLSARSVAVRRTKLEQWCPVCVKEARRTAIRRGQVLDA